MQVQKVNIREIPTPTGKDHVSKPARFDFGRVGVSPSVSENIFLEKEHDTHMSRVERNKIRVFFSFHSLPLVL